MAKHDHSDEDTGHPAEEHRAHNGKLKTRMRKALKRISPRAARFTDQAHRVLTLAQAEAQRLNHDYIGTEHLLLAMMSEGQGIAARALANLGIDLDQARETVLRIVGRGTSTDAIDNTDVTKWNLAAASKKTIELAVDEARRLKQDYIGTEHLLLGLIRERDGGAAAVMASLGVTPEQIRAQVMDLIATIGEAVKPAKSKAPKNNVVMCRLDDQDLDAVDTLIEAGICNTRSDAAAWLIHAGIEANATLLTSVRDTVVEIRRLREEARGMAQRATSRDAASTPPSLDGNEESTSGASST